MLESEEDLGTIFSIGAKSICIGKRNSETCSAQHSSTKSQSRLSLQVPPWRLHERILYTYTYIHTHILIRLKHGQTQVKLKKKFRQARLGHLSHVRQIEQIMYLQLRVSGGRWVCPIIRLKRV